MIERHAGPDKQAARHYSLGDMLDVGRAAEIAFSVAGGIDHHRITQVEAAIAAAGAAIYGAADPASAARALHEAIRVPG